MNKIAFFYALLLLGVFGCGNKPSEDDIYQKVLADYVCKHNARVNNLKILRTEKTESTDKPTIYRYSIQGEVEWPEGCNEASTNTPPGTKEKFERLVTLYKTENGNWE